MDLVLRAAFVFGFMVLLTRVIGKRELGSLQPFDLILLIILGDALQQGMTQDDYSQIAHISDVQCAILETSGQISFIPKESR